MIELNHETSDYPIIFSVHRGTKLCDLFRKIQIEMKRVTEPNDEPELNHETRDFQSHNYLSEFIEANRTETRH